MNEIATNRRTLLRNMAAMPAIGIMGAAAMGGTSAFAATSSGVNLAPPLAAGKVAKIMSAEDRGLDGLFPRMGDLDLESYQDFLGSRGMYGRKLGEAAMNRAEALIWKAGIDPTKESDMTMEDVVELIKDDPLFARASRFGMDNHYDAFVRLRDHFHQNGSYYDEELTKAEKTGPGKLMMSPGMELPDYTKHEIHNQVGGYVGDPFAGMMYYYGTLVLNDSANRQDEMFDAIMKNMPMPADGKVVRMLDNGCGTGQLATAMKRKFPNAEVWGLDAAGPMLRYAHYRSTKIGVPVNYAQRLAEDNGFPDNYFDVIASSSFHHEVTADASRKIFKEVQRVLRPGGIYRPAESGINGYPVTPLGKATGYMGYRVNHEVWMLDWGGMKPYDAMREAGLKVDPNGTAGYDAGAALWLKTIGVVATKA